MITAGKDQNQCPLSGAEGKALRQFSGEHLASFFPAHIGVSLPEELQTKYYSQAFTEYESAISGLRWFSPILAAEEDFYAFLADHCEWYYQENGWDKGIALDFLVKQNCKSLLEVGCGAGLFLDRARVLGIHGSGVDINTAALSKARSKGLDVSHPAEGKSGPTEALCMFQVLEHLPQPLKTLQEYIEPTDPEWILISVPSYESTLGLTSDPLVWPPHHITFWSEKSLRFLAGEVGYEMHSFFRQPVYYRDFVHIWRKEETLESPIGRFRPSEGWDRISQSLNWSTQIFDGDPTGIIRKAARLANRRWGDDPTAMTRPPAFSRFRWLLSRLQGKDWAFTRNSIFAVLRKK